MLPGMMPSSPSAARLIGALAGDLDALAEVPSCLYVVVTWQ